MASIGDYDIGQLLGRGGFAVVYRARDRKTNADVAVKVIDRAAMLDKGALARIVNEIKVHRLLKHDKIVAMRNCFESDTHIFIVMELCSYGNLFRYLKQHGPLSEQDASTVIRQLLDALDYLHSRGIVHRDLKLSNILLSCDPSQQLHIKVCDFGLAVQLQHPDEEHYTLCGTPNYIAPEVASQQAHSYPADLWSVGCLFYSLVVGSPPFEQGDVKETLRNILSGKYAEPTTLSCSALDFLRKLLHLVSRSSYDSL